MNAAETDKIVRAVIALIFPPIAVLDRGCGTALLVGILTLFGWIPGVLLAWYLIFKGQPYEKGEPRYVQVPATGEAMYEKPKRKGAYTRLADGEIFEVVDDDHAPLETPDKQERTGI
ncbi:MAG: YqaE/Pmp3 family membrane protein [Anaerolineae bacterium]|nr:YqaE/Pmp3 family membrane protein [Anaerolineae bacterium]